MTNPRGANPATPRRAGARRVVALCLALLCAVLFSLGVWQVQRLQWKKALIAQVDGRVHAPATAAPPAAAWTALSRDNDEYRHLRLEGRFLDQLSTRVQAVTELGAGFWVLTPFIIGGSGGSDGAVVLINRGFIPSGATPADAGPGPVGITGLLRMSERGGGFLRDNDPKHNRWYSRDAEAIGAARGLTRIAPWFLDQDATTSIAPKTGSDPFNREVQGVEIKITNGSDPINHDVQGTGRRTTNGSDPFSRVGAPVAPVAGLTVVSFHNSHLVYALTWFAMGLMSAGASYAIARGKI